MNARDIGLRLLDLLLPPTCLGCGVSVDEQGRLCGSCWGSMTFLAPPACACCGQPFPHALPLAALCAACIAEPPPYRRARAVFRYDDASRGLVLAFKHADRTEAAPAFARWMARAGAELVAECDLVVPVPLHWTRLFRRRYNQAALIAKGLAEIANLPYRPDVLRRRRATPSQGGRGRAGRRRNVEGAFVVPLRRRSQLAGRNVLLVDDVLTTGATVTASARALLRAGAAAVDVLTIARVVRE